MDFYFDENIPDRIAQALNYLEGENRKHNVFYTGKEFKTGIIDVELFPLISKAKGIFITNDLKVAHRKVEIELLKELNIPTYLLCFRQGATYWERVLMIMEKWPYIKETALYYEPNGKHYICKIKVKGKPEITF